MEGEKLSVEGGFSSKEIDPFIAHYPEHEVWTDLNLFFGGAHTVMASRGEYTGSGDPRRGGVCRVVQ
jgi:gamma-glutamyltranspeptidase/glutathione hydrolase